MPFEEARAYRFNPFDLTKVWPHGDYPLHEVGRLTLDRNPTDFHSEIEQAAFEPNNLVPGIGVSPDKMLLARVFSYADAHRARMGVNYKQIPVNRRRSPVHSYSKDGAMRMQKVVRPRVRAELEGRPGGRPGRYPYVEMWEADGEFVHAAYTLSARRRRLGPGGHAGARGHGRRPARPARLQRRRAPQPRRVPDPSWSAPSSTGATSTKQIGDRIAEGVKGERIGAE